jgi:hypothetical protein
MSSKSGTTPDLGKVVRGILKDADEAIGRVKISSPVDYVVAYANAVDKAIAACPLKPTSFTAVFTSPRGVSGAMDFSGKSLDEVLELTPLSSSTFAIFAWHSEENSTRGTICSKKWAVWNDRNGLAFGLYEADGEMKLAYAINPNLAA